MMAIDKDLLLRVVTENINETTQRRKYWSMNYQSGMVTAWKSVVEWIASQDKLEAEAKRLGIQREKP